MASDPPELRMILGSGIGEIPARRSASSIALSFEKRANVW